MAKKKAKKQTVAQAEANNMAVFLKHGPSLRKDYSTFVVARCPNDGRILIGGLGCMGVGQMWRPERPEDKDRPGYDDAEIVSMSPNSQPFQFNLGNERPGR
jgi:hypothetical protein